MKPRICLNMIVKNEAPVIARCLASVRPFIDTWVIVDTGSTDGTQQLISDCLRGLPGELHQRPWRNFGVNRSEAIALARGKAAYTLIIDADEVLEAEPGFVMPALTADAYELKTILADNSYYRTQLVRGSLPWRWEGVLHEYLACDAPLTQGRLEGLVNRPRADGARSADPEKYAKDAAVLEEALARDPNNTRYAFYLAQSYRDAGKLEKALEAYQRRLKLGGWDEEVYFAMHQVGRLKEALGRPEPEVVHAYLAAYQFRPTRAETLVLLAQYLRVRNQFALAYLFASRAAAMPRPDDNLFVELSSYVWRARDELALAAHYLGRHEEAVQLGRELLADARVPASERDRLASNLGFYEAGLRQAERT